MLNRFLMMWEAVRQHSLKLLEGRVAQQRVKSVCSETHLSPVLVVNGLRCHAQDPGHIRSGFRASTVLRPREMDDPENLREGCWRSWREIRESRNGWRSRTDSYVPPHRDLLTEQLRLRVVDEEFASQDRVGSLNAAVGLSLEVGKYVLIDIDRETAHRDTRRTGCAASIREVLVVRKSYQLCIRSYAIRIHPWTV